MFVFSVKMSKRQWLFLVFCVVALIVLLLAAVSGSKAKPTAASVGKTAEGGNETARVSFLRSLGYSVLPPHTAVKEVLIPDLFDAETEDYNELQLSAGWDLSPYHGKRVKCWTYTLQNDPSGEPAEAHLYEYNGRIIGGDVAATEAGGFMRALTPVG